MKFFKNNFVVKFTLTLFLISIIIGLLLYFTYTPDLKSYIENFKEIVLNTKQNTFMLHIGIILIIFISSISLIGLPLIIFYLFFEGVSIGFTIGAFLGFNGIKGFLFYFLYFICSKLLFDILALYFTIISIRFSYKLLGNLIYKNKDELYKIIMNQFIRFIILFGVVVINSVLIYFLSNTIVKLFVNLI